MSHAASSCIQNSADAPVEAEQSAPESEAVHKEAPDVQCVLKKVGFTSATFIGPAFPPKKHIDESLSDFYKEIQAIDDEVEKERDAFNQLETSTRKLPEKRLMGEDRCKPSGKPPKMWDSGRDPEKQKRWPPRWHRYEPYYTHNLRSPSWNHPDYDPPPMFRPPPNHRSFHRFHHPLPPPPSSDMRYGYPPRFPPFPRFSPPPHYSHHDAGRSYDAPPQRHSEYYDARQQHCDAHLDQTSSSVLILMRGLPGSGKTTMARELLATGPSGLILSTDDYFVHDSGYRYDPNLLGEAHEWNHQRAGDAMRDGRSPVIIDNTNLQAWEMKPYVQMALQQGYQVDFCEPNTSWKYDPSELEKRNKHGVSQEKIAQMLDRFCWPVSIDAVLSSQEPQHVQQRHQPEQSKDGAHFE
ncbi:NEDD4-binding protein 2-like 2 [Syngnathus acus]|uniref:NEDD4-binding protein 2-like 2 n=1 Tax=Syngnathus acus TaxID=161584 RepID=UPI0018862365|nr:NEDD4-binding protein 2-like 2 [Syngnathus acus]